MKKYLFITCLLLAMLSAWLAKSLYESGVENKRLHSNQEALMGEVKLYETEAGKSAASAKRQRTWG